jgi:hypothetical protein
MLGVRDLTRSKKFYGEGLGGTIDKDYPAFVSLSLGDGSSSLALYEREAAANDAGVSAEGSGFTGARSITSSPPGRRWTRSSPAPRRPAVRW